MKIKANFDDNGESQWVEVFKSGKHDIDGPKREWSKNDVKQIVNNYDPIDFHEAPLTRGHIYFDDAVESYGWVSKLKYQAGSMFAKFKQVDPIVPVWVESGKFKKLSSGLRFYAPEEELGKEGWYLHHVAFVTTPGAKGMADPVFKDADDEDVICCNSVSFADDVFGSNQSVEAEKGKKAMSEEATLLQKITGVADEVQKLRDDLKSERQAREEAEARHAEATDLLKSLKQEREQEKAAHFADGLLSEWKEKKIPPAVLESARSAAMAFADDEEKAKSAVEAICKPCVGVFDDLSKLKTEDGSDGDGPPALDDDKRLELARVQCADLIKGKAADEADAFCKSYILTLGDMADQVLQESEVK
jgi:hypothetical protein